MAERHFRLHFPRFRSVTVQSLKVTNVLNLYREEYRRQASLTRITTFLFSFDSFPLFPPPPPPPLLQVIPCFPKPDRWPLRKYCFRMIPFCNELSKRKGRPYFGESENPGGRSCRGGKKYLIPENGRRPRGRASYDSTVSITRRHFVPLAAAAPFLLTDCPLSG